MPTLSASDSGVNLMPVSNACDVAPPVALATDTFAVAPPSIPAHHTPTLPVPRPRTPRMKFAKCGIRATKAFFLHPDKVEMYPTLSDTVYFDGKIDQCPRKENVDYVFHWTKMVGLPPDFDMTHLRTRVFKQNKEGMCLLRCAREDYDRVYPNQPRPQQTTTSRTPVSIDPTFRSQETLTGLRMSPIFDSPVDRQPRVNVEAHYSNGDESASDDGSDLEQGDTYLPFEEGADDNSPDSAYDPEYMEMDGQYNVANLANTTFHYEELLEDEELQPPANMYDGPGPCLRRGVASRFHTAFDYAKVCGGLSYTFFKRLTANSNQYGRQNTDSNGNFAGLPW